MKECVLYEKLEDNRVRCTACNHRCFINEDQTGICGIRKNIDGKLYLLVYGKPISINIDPIEKKPLYHFLPGTYSYSLGTIGCNFRCLFCQNYDISQFKEVYGEVAENILKNILGITPEKIIENAIKTGCESISYTYNEPTIFIEFVKDIAVLAKKVELKNILVTNGYMTKESFDFIKTEIDAMNIDLKSFSEDFYRKLCGARLNPVLETIKRAYKHGIHIEITTLLIPGKNDSKQELEKIAKFIFSLDNKGEIPWHISRFFPMYKMTDTPITPIETLKKAEKIGKRTGLKYVYLGNVSFDGL